MHVGRHMNAAPRALTVVGNVDGIDFFGFCETDEIRKAAIVEVTYFIRS